MWTLATPCSRARINHDGLATGCYKAWAMDGSFFGDGGDPLCAGPRPAVRPCPIANHSRLTSTPLTANEDFPVHYADSPLARRSADASLI